MSILDTETSIAHRKASLKKTSSIYLWASVLCVAVDRVYALFAHHVISIAMDTMFLIPLLAGCLPIGLAARHGSHNPCWRISLNLYGAALANATVGRMYDGIHYIAGGGAPWSMNFYISALCLLACSALAWLYGKRVEKASRY